MAGTATATREPARDLNGVLIVFPECSVNAPDADNISNLRRQKCTCIKCEPSREQYNDHNLCTHMQCTCTCMIKNSPRNACMVYQQNIIRINLCSADGMIQDNFQVMILI